MPRTLYLLRHAQATETQHAQHDIDRELNTQGMREAASTGHYLKKNNFEVDLIVSSTAKRAKATSALIHGILNIGPEFVAEEQLYQASVRNLLHLTKELDDDFKKILLVGHNPYISYFAEYLTKAEIGDMKTAGLACIHFEINNWSEISEGIGSLEIYVHPSIIEK